MEHFSIGQSVYSNRAVDFGGSPNESKWREICMGNGQINGQWLDEQMNEWERENKEKNKKEKEKRDYYLHLW